MHLSWKHRNHFVYDKHFLRQTLFWVHSCTFTSFLFGTALKPRVWEKGMPPPQVSDGGWGVEMLLEVVSCWSGYPLVEALQQCEAASCPRHTIVVSWPAWPSFLSSPLSAMMPFDMFHGKAAAEGMSRTFQRRPHAALSGFMSLTRKDRQLVLTELIWRLLGSQIF